MRYWVSDLSLSLGRWPGRWGQHTKDSTRQNPKFDFFLFFPCGRRCCSRKENAKPKTKSKKESACGQCLSHHDLVVRCATFRLTMIAEVSFPSLLVIALSGTSTSTLFWQPTTHNTSYTPWHLPQRYTQRLLTITRYPTGQLTPNLGRGYFIKHLMIWYNMDGIVN